MLSFCLSTSEYTINSVVKGLLPKKKQDEVIFSRCKTICSHEKHQGANWVSLTLAKSVSYPITQDDLDTEKKSAQYCKLLTPKAVIQMNCLASGLSLFCLVCVCVCMEIISLSIQVYLYVHTSRKYI